jgi:hypothetical protein
MILRPGARGSDPVNEPAPEPAPEIPGSDSGSGWGSGQRGSAMRMVPHV